MFDIISLITWFRNTFTRRDFLLFFVILALFFTTRLINLDQFPVFSDEGIYIRWAKVAWQDASWRFISLTDGRQPLQTWATIPFLKLFPDQALLAGRLFGVSCGLLALTGLFSLLFYLFGKKTAFIGMFLYVVTPYYLFYDRMALMDSGVNAFFIWILFFSILLVRTRRLDVALLFGLMGGLASWSKSSVRIFFLTALFAPLLIFTQKIRTFIQNSASYYILFAGAASLSFLIYNVQRLSQFFHNVSNKNTTFVMSGREFLEEPFSVIFRNLRIVPMYFSWEMGFVLVILGAVGFYWLYKKDPKLCLYLLVWFMVPFFVISLVAKVVFPRYIMFLGTVFLITASYYFSQVKGRVLIASAAAVFISIAYFNYTILFDFKNIPFPQVDRGQYIEGPPAVWGARELMEFAREKSLEKPVVLLAEGNFGLIGDVLEVFRNEGDDISIRGYWPLDRESIKENEQELEDKYVYIVFSHRDEFPMDWPMKQVKKYEKPGDRSAVHLFELIKE